jgi:hypothetical protein
VSLVECQKYSSAEGTVTRKRRQRKNDEEEILHSSSIILIQAVRDEDKFSLWSSLTIISFLILLLYMTSVSEKNLRGQKIENRDSERQFAKALKCEDFSLNFFSIQS